MAAQDLTYRPSGIVVAGKRVLDLLEGALPQRLFATVYKTAFKAYRAAIRHLYLRRWVSAASRGDGARRRRAETVFRVMPRSLVGWSGLEASYDAVTDADRRGVPGSIVECGVAEGGCAALMALANNQSSAMRPLWLFDSYEGLPEPGEGDFREGRTGAHLRPLPRGACRGTIEQVSELLFDELSLDKQRVNLVKGWFQDTLPGAKERVGGIAVLRIDADWYESVRCCLENLYDSVAPGGYVIIDDYGTCYGAERAVDEFLAARRIDVQLTPDGRGGCLFIKPPA